MPTRPRVLAFFDIDLTVRHFLQSGEIRRLEERFDTTYVFNREPDARPRQQKLTIDPTEFNLPRVLFTDVSRRRTGHWYPLYAATALNFQRGTGNYQHRRYILQTQTKSERHVRRFERFSHPFVFPLFKRAFVSAMGLHKGLMELISTERPDALVYPSTLNGPHMAELARIAHVTGVPLIVLMNSWDNPSGKAFPVEGISHLVVWGEQTKQHAVTYMRMPPERVHPFGAAQFEIYRQPVATSRNELAADYGVPVDSRIAVYAGIWSGPHETIYLKELNEIAASGNLGHIHFIYRPHPWRGPLAEGEANFFDLDLEHVTMDPTMVPFYRECVEQGRSSLFMADYRDTARLLSLVDFTLSPMSTISLESILIGKPSVLLMARDTLPGLMENPPIRIRELCALEGAVSCERLEVLEDSCRTALAFEHNLQKQAAMAKQRNYLAVLDGPRYMDKVIDLVAECIGQKPQREAA